MQKAVSTAEVGGFEIQEAALEAPEPGWVNLRVRATGICGSDLHAMHEPARWRAGHVPGHEFSGEIESLGAGVEGWDPGDRVSVFPGLTCGRCDNCRSGRWHLCDAEFDLFGLTRPGGFSQELGVPASSLFRLGDDTDFVLGAMWEPLAVAIHGYRLAARLDPDRPTSGERVVVLGAGIIGLLSAYYAKEAGASAVAITAKYPHQANAARRLGADAVFGSDAEGQAALDEWAGRNVDVVIETVGARADTLADAVRIVRRGGRISLLGVFTSDPRLPAEGLTLKEPRIVVPFAYSYSGPHADQQMALDLLNRDRELLTPLVTHRFALAAAEEAFQTAADKSSASIKVIVEP
jgi:threonine dehydrogenase-like Zn-dependent dehydrogenase